MHRSMHDGRCMNPLLACFHACASSAAPTTLPCLHCTTARVRIGFPFSRLQLCQAAAKHGARTDPCSRGSVDGASSAEGHWGKRGKSVPALPYWCRRSCMHQPVRGPVRARAQMTHHTLAPKKWEKTTRPPRLGLVLKYFAKSTL